MSDWSRVRGIVDAALDLPAEERSDYVRGACDDDADLIADVERLLGHDDEAGLTKNLLERSDQGFLLRSVHFEHSLSLAFERRRTASQRPIARGSPNWRPAIRFACPGSSSLVRSTPVRRLTVRFLISRLMRAPGGIERVDSLGT